MKNLKKNIFIVLLVFFCSNLKGQVIKFIGAKPNENYNSDLRFEKIISKGDSILGFNKDYYYSISLNKGKDWKLIDLKKQLVENDGNNYSLENIDVFLKNDNIIVFVFGKFFISKDFGRHFERINKNKSLKVGDGDLGANVYSPDAYITDDFYYIRGEDGIYCSKDCNIWKKLKTPENVVITKFAAYKKQLFIATYKNIYASNDQGISWNKIENIVFKYDVATMRNLGGITEISAFNNKLYIDYYAGNSYIYDLINNTETKLENVKSTFLKNDTLFVLTNYKTDNNENKTLENSEILYYKDSLIKSNIDITKIYETNSRLYFANKNIYINDNYAILDGRYSVPILSNINNKNIGCISGNCNDGEGINYFADGNKYEGSWVNGKMDGTGAYYYANGDILKGIWKNGENIKIDYHLQNGKISTYIQNDSSNSKNQIALGIYNLERYLQPATKEYKINIKTFQNVIASGDSFYSLVYSPMSSDIFNQQRPSVGSFFLKTNFITNTTTDIIKEANPSYDSNNANLNTYNFNNNLSELNSIYSLEPLGNSFRVSELSFDSNKNSYSYTDTYTIPDEFELKSKDGNIETFNFRNIKIGNGICGFLAQSMYDYKTYLFIYNNKSKDKYTKIDISKISINLAVNNTKSNGVGTTFRGRRNNRDFETNLFSVSNIVQNDKYIYAFLEGGSSPRIILPIKINKLNFSVQVMSESFMTMSNFRSQEFTNKPISEDGYFYMPSSKGFLNYYKVYDNGFEGYHLDYYNAEFIKTWKSKIKDIVINHVYESGDYIILGGYTKSQGYKGYPNPKIVVINKKTYATAYEKVIAKKNGEVGLISSDFDGNIIIAVGSFCCQAYDTDSKFIPQIILDKLKPNGAFENDLFAKQ